MTRVAIILVALAFAVARFFMPSHALSPAGSYEAAAHLFVGGLIIAWFVIWRVLKGLMPAIQAFIGVSMLPPESPAQEEAAERVKAFAASVASIGKLCGLVALALSAVELTAFFVLKGR